MDHACTCKVTLIDTAATYSAGASERIVGAWLASRRPKPGTLSVATKIYPPFTPEAIDPAVAASASRLGVEIIDLLYLHKWDATAETPAALIALDGLLRSGRVRALGVSNFTADQLRPVLAQQARLGLTSFRVLQNNNNLAVRDVDGPLVELCAAHGMAIVTYSPLGGGFLTGKHRNGVQPGSRFDVAPGHQGVYFNPTCERRLARLEEVSKRAGQPMAHLALAWALHRPGRLLRADRWSRTQISRPGFRRAPLNDPVLFGELESA